MLFEADDTTPPRYTPLTPTHSHTHLGLCCVQPAFEYIENRLTGNCAASYDCTETYTLFRLAQAFDPSFAATSLTRGIVDELAKMTPLATHNLIPGLLLELPNYLLAAATCPGFDRTDIKAFTDGVLLWWKHNNPKFPTWAIAARIVFAITPSSAASERVFSLVKCMFGKDQLSSLGDQLQGSAMLRYNRHNIG